MKVRTQERRDAIVRAAAELFEELGYEAASMSELSKRLGGSKATLYGYFASKEELLQAVVQAFSTGHLSDATAGLTADLERGIAGAAALRAALIAFGERALKVLTNDRTAAAIYRIVVAASGRSDVGRLFHDAGPKQSVDALAALMKGAIARRELRALDPRVLAMQFLALLTAEISARICESDPPPVRPAQIRLMVERAVDLLLLGASPRK